MTIIRPAYPSSRQGGFTVVEIMVGMALGLLLVLVITQVMSVVEAQNRTTMGSAEAQTNGGIALYTIGRELQLAGYPLIAADATPLECTTAGMVATLTPATITDGNAVAGVSPASDAITIRYGSASDGGVPRPIDAVSGNNLTLQTSLGCQVGDVALVTSGASCGSANVTAVDGDNKTITLSNAAAASAAVGASLSCLGAWNAVTFAVNNGNLERNGTPILSGIVNLQAQYGIAASANSNQVTRWVNARNLADWDATVDGASTSIDWGSSITPDNRNRIKAVRLAVVARNDKNERQTVSAACSSTTTEAPTGVCAWTGNADSPAPVIDLAPGNPDWRQYRYRTFETVIPLRNVIWSKDAL